MHCYRVTTYRVNDPVYILVAKQQEAFALAREATTDHRSPVVALVDLQVDKAHLVNALNDPQAFVMRHMSLKAWEFYKRGTQAVGREIEPNSGEPVRSKSAAYTLDADKFMSATNAGRNRMLREQRKQRVHPSVKEAAKTNPDGWPQVTLKKGV